ncbi:Lysophospholipid acyltransferase LPEAT2 [Camellia lanceoleosa]|uniref:Lysophospholipid acyltransferase LPEAT2 n=1 Tax=Camellia lanceoleosa TaxID=1840588 RepID=A0ACC0FJ48_9ERIC|nr:Lysophospholipid acyltransferase LPEAT2 [Camellia lanceoleosa]
MNISLLWGHHLFAKASESKQENPSLYTVEMANVESAVDFLDTFLSMNPNSSGQVRIPDFFKVLRLNHKLCDLLCNSTLICCCIFGVLDVEKKGKITFKKMENLLLAVPIWVSSCPTATIFRRACELAFAECHTGGNHYISEQELGDSIKPAILNMDEFEIHELLKSFEPDSDVRINKDDFIACLRRNPLLVALFSPQLMHKNLSRVNT